MIDLKNLNHEAIALLERFKGGSFPIPVVSIATEHGIGVFSDSSYAENVNGHIELTDEGKIEIIVNPSHSPERTRFTIAHEIAHFLMDMDYLKAHKSIDRDGDAADPSYRAREIRANNFAAALLMPEAEFVRQWFALDDLQKAADYFGVSKLAAKLRAINTGILKVE